MPRKYFAFLTLVTAVLLVLGFGIVYKANQDKQQLKVNGTSFTKEIVATDETRQQGLSGRDSLAADTAMIFVFDEPGQRCFWMKDMKFNIDIVWLNSAKRVVGVKENATPASYPDNFCYDNAQYVVEFVAGTADRLQLETDTQFSW